ncbi:MAG: maltose alpha-D-glucosyltransferase [Sneathiellaceae bacterium]
MTDTKRGPAGAGDGGSAAGTDPQWYKDAVIYQLHVKAFFDADNDGMGDFAGLMQKLDYVQELGCNTVWLLPFYPSPMRDDGYDIADYRRVNAAYGTMRDFRRFVREAHSRGLRVITELVINHTSDQHAWFQKARRAKPGSVARDFYVWSDTDQRYLDTRIIFLDTETSNWTWDPEAKAYFWHRFYSHQPDLNFDNPRVLQEIVSVLHYWMEMGVDGMRLDAVPYLVEREGTNNENLPETHGVLKRIRAEMDSHYEGRMLLAEANQWPEDTRPYFGDGDECHMAFHFPLMPRMYMALAQEDRYPVTDIIRQTPEIPETCQWAVFLRNHDELTLEMVTDRERDYLWDTYAKDRRMRINLGIRRRLAPLLDNDRRKIELMNALLFSMPGTPVIYYGDELGMGDNVFLGDRDGVRTPMQWSPDRNAGFSRASPQSLYLPPIMDAVYGYEAVNVEAEQADQSSLLNWMKRLLAVRGRHPAFGRGDIQFLYPRNRKILAYTREHDGETLLCVANLSRAAQAAELDLSAWRGQVPVELLGPSTFPPIGELPYLLTLPAYGFYWFLLAAEAELPHWHVPVPDAAPDFVTLVAQDGWSELSALPARRHLEREILPDFLQNQRWFGAKQNGRTVVHFRTLAELRAVDGGILLAEVRVPDGTDGEIAAAEQRYQLPLAQIWGEQHLAHGAPTLSYTLARLRRGPRLGALHDATATPALGHALHAEMCGDRDLPGEGGRLEARGTAALRALKVAADAPVERLGGEQSNTSLNLDGQVMMKLYRRLQAGPQPEIEMARHLTEVSGFANTPAYLGALHWVADGGERTALAVAFAMVRHQGDAWRYSLDWLERYLGDEALHAEEAELPAAERFGTYLNLAAMLGRRTAEMHAALARPSDDDAFAPVPAGASDRRRWLADAHRQHDRTRRALQAVRHEAEGPQAARIDELLAARDAIAARVDAAGEVPLQAALTRLHGDYHLGQVLVSRNDVFIIDFEGEPSRTMAERRVKCSPLRDVAGMMRSFDFAARSALRWAQTQPVGEEAAREVVVSWSRASRQVFWTSYAAGMEGAESWPGEQVATTLLDLFALEKVLYEIAYEATNRPNWIDVPLAGLAAMLGMEESDGSVAE